MRRRRSVGDPGLGRGARAPARQGGTAVERATARSDSEVSAILTEPRWGAVAVVTRDDVLALRLTLLSAHLRADLPLWVTMFDRTIARELHHVVPAVQVLSPAELVAADLAEQCVGAAGPVPPHRRTGTQPGRRCAAAARARRHRASARPRCSRGSIGMIALHESVVDALYFSTRSVATVAGTPGATTAAAWYKTLSVRGHAGRAAAGRRVHGGARAPSEPSAPDDAARRPRGAGASATYCSSASVRSASAWRRSSVDGAWRSWASSAIPTRRAFDSRARRASRWRLDVAMTARRSSVWASATALRSRL